MAMTKRDRATGPAAVGTASTDPTGPARRSHLPGDGTAAAEAIERARREMLHEGGREHREAAERRERRARIGADVVCEAILRQGVDVLFGYPGGVILPLYDVLGDHPALRHVLVRHEQGGAHAADGYARATGKVGVCLGTSGPAATNLVTGIATAQLDSIPMVAITGNVASALLGKDAFQEIDITGITLPMTKHNYLVRDADELPRVLAEAFYIARTGRPGPVHVDITKDALQQETNAPHPTDEEVARRYARLPPEPRRPPAPAPPGRGRDRPRQTAAHLRRPRRADRRRDGRASRARRTDPDPGGLDAPRDRRYRRDAPARLRVHGDARLEARQPGDPGGRPDHRDRDALRRPGDRERQDVRAVRPHRPRGHRPGRDRQERGRRGAGRRRCEARPRGAAADAPGDRPGGPRRVPRPAGGVAARIAGRQLARLGRLAAGLSLRRLRGRADRRRHRPRRDDGRRRGPEPDVDGPLCGLPAAPQPPLVRRARDDGLRGPDRDGRGARPPRQVDLGGLRRRRLPDDDPGAGNPGPGPDPRPDRAPRQQEAGHDPAVAGDLLRGQLPLVEPVRARLPEALRGVRDPGLEGDHARAGSVRRSRRRRRWTARPSSGSRSRRSRTSSR